MLEFADRWKKADGYQKFELILTLVVVAVVSIIALFAVMRLVIRLFDLLFLSLDFLSAGTFQILFGMIFIVLIALEFNRSILHALSAGIGVIQIKGVVLIATMVVARKIILMDIKETSLELLLGLSALLLSLGALYFLISRDPVEAQRRNNP